MEWIADFFTKLHHLDELVVWAGYIGLAAIIFCETGLLAGFFLPGDSLLVTAGLIAAQGKFDIVHLNLLLIAAAIIGDSVGYWIGYSTGPKIFNRQESWFFHRNHLQRTHDFFEKYGSKTIILARFVPIVRTFAPTAAGVGRMTYQKFLSYNVVGGIGWVMTMTLLGYFLGRSVPNIERHLHIIIAVIIVLSFLPLIFELRRKSKS